MKRIRRKQHRKPSLNKKDVRARMNELIGHQISDIFKVREDSRMIWTDDLEDTSFVECLERCSAEWRGKSSIHSGGPPL